MRTISIRELRNHGGDVVELVAGGEEVTVTRGGRPVAELRPVRRRGLPAALLLPRWRHLQAVDPAALRADIDTILDDRL